MFRSGVGPEQLGLMDQNQQQHLEELNETRSAVRAAEEVRNLLSKSTKVILSK